MAWMSRNVRPQSAESPADAERADGPGGLSPKVVITGFDVAPAELEWQLPVRGELRRLMPGPDRPDYSLLVLEQPLHFYPPESFDLSRVQDGQRTEDRRGRSMVRVNALLVCSRFVGQQLHPGMTDLPVSLAYVIDPSLAQDAVVDFAKIEFAATGSLSEVAATAEAPIEPGELSSAGPPAMIVVGEVFPEAARTLHEGIARQRDRAVERLAVTLTLDEQHRVVGMSGNADGEPPVPTPETFERMNEVLSELNTLPASHAVEKLTLRVDGQHVSSDVEYRSS